jgi:hypothetical protein
LQTIKEKGPIQKQYGICINVDHAIHKNTGNYVSVSLLAATACWGNSAKFSLAYPIEDVKSKLSPSTQYINAHLTGNMWDRRTRYGKLRWELLDHLIEYYTERESD